MGLYSQEYTGRFIAKKSQLQWMVDGGYKTHMIFAMDPVSYTHLKAFVARLIPKAVTTTSSITCVSSINVIFKEV